MEFKETCGNCHYADMTVITMDDEEMPHLVCRRYPPKEVLWPLVHEEEWCGEWAQKLRS